ncbi:MAG: hypothetical protein K2O24_08580 [Muribaculaceae bacterium]|nr:hypothetical protein [Muribaculaceae bacterium]
MTLKFGSLLLLAGVAATASAQEPTAIGSIYSEVGVSPIQNGVAVYEAGNWFPNGTSEDGLSTLWNAVFADLAEGPMSLVEGVTVDADGIAVSWNAAAKLLTVNCEAGKLGRTQVLIADYSGMNRDVVTLKDTPASISLSDYVPGTYVVAVAVDGNLVKTIKLILK